MLETYEVFHYAIYYKVTIFTYLCQCFCKQNIFLNVDCVLNTGDFIKGK